MRLQRQCSAILSVMLLTSIPSPCASKELITLQTQVQGLQDRLSQLQRGLNEYVGVMTNLVNRNSENLQNLERKLQQLEERFAQQTSVDDTRLEEMTAADKYLNDG